MMSDESIVALQPVPRELPPAIYTLVKLSNLAFRLYFRLRCEGREHAASALKAGKQVLAISNHASNLDLFALMACLNTDLIPYFAFPGKQELFSNRFFSWFLHGLGGFPLDRDSADVAAARMLIKTLRAGVSVGIAPEGTRSPDGEVQPFKDGFVKLALKFKVPIVPAAIIGTFKALPRGTSVPRPRRVTVRFGPLLDLATLDVPGEGPAREAALAEAVRQAVIALQRAGHAWGQTA